MEINNETILLIKSKVPLYKNKNYFRIFKDIFIDFTMKYLKTENISIELKMKKNNNNEYNIKKNFVNEYENASLWVNVMKNIFINKEIKNYVLRNDLLVKNQFNPNKKDDEDYCYVFTRKKNNNYMTNNLVYLYLSHLSKIKLHTLNIISKKEKTPLTNIVRIYLGLCAQNIELLKLKSKNEKKRINKERFSSRKLLIKNLNLKDEMDKKENSPKDKILNNEPKFNNNIKIKIKYISDLKTRLAKKFINSRNNNKEKDKIISENNKEELSNNIRNIDKEEEKKENNFPDDLINEEFIKSLNSLNKKTKNFSLKILYSSSFTRLFIGETDIDSIRERYLSNIEEKLGNNKNLNKSQNYLKTFVNRIIQNPKNQLPLIEKNMENLISKFKKNQEIIDKFKRICLEEEKEKRKEKEKKKLILKRMNTVMNDCNENMKFKLDFNIDDINKNKNFTSYTSYKFRRNGTLRTPKRGKEIINNYDNDNDNDKNNQNVYKSNKNKSNNLSYNKKGIRGVSFNLNKNNINNKYKERTKKNNKIFKINIKNNLFKDINKNILLTERNNSTKKSHFKTIFEKKLFRNKDNCGNNINNESLSLNRNKTTQEERFLYDKTEKFKNYKTKNFFTRNDFYF